MTINLSKSVNIDHIDSNILDVIGREYIQYWYRYD